MDGKHVPDINDDKTLWPGVLNFQIRFVNGSNSVLLPITCTFKALKTFLPELLPFNFLKEIVHQNILLLEYIVHL